MCDPILATLLKMRPHYSQSSRKSATPSSGTSPLASYKGVPSLGANIPVPAPILSVSAQRTAPSSFVLTDYLDATHVPAPSRMSAAVAGPRTIQSSCFPAWVSPKLAVDPTDPPTWAIVARDKLQLQAGNLVPPVSTSTNVDVLAKELSGHPDGNFLGNLLNSLFYGTPVGYLGPYKPQVSHNLQSAAQHPDVVSSNLTKEIGLGRVAVPFYLRPFPISSVTQWG